MCPFEDYFEAYVAPGENEFDTSALHLKCQKAGGFYPLISKFIFYYPF